MLLRQFRIYRDDLRANPDVLYIFGDNEMRVGRLDHVEIDCVHRGGVAGLVAYKILMAT